MTFAAPLFLLAALAGLIPVLRAPDPPPEGQGDAVQHASISPGQRAADAAAEVRGRRVLAERAGGGAAADRRWGWPAPRFEPGRASGAGGQTTAIAIVLDNSASMAVTDGGKPGSRPPGRGPSRCSRSSGRETRWPCCRPADRPARSSGRLFRTHETVRQALDQCRPSYERADLAARIQQARDLLAAGGCAQQGNLRLHRQPEAFLGRTERPGRG